MHFINLSGYLAASVQIKPVVPVVHANFGTNRSTGATWAQAEGIKKKKKRQRKKITVANWVFAQTTHVDAAICGLACRVVFGR